jgi:exonuclease SbcC
MLKVKEIAIEGFRGFNRRQVFTPSERLTIIFGPNGTGKTSLCQAIEFGLFGEVPDLQGPEFKREDAIANSNHPKGDVFINLKLKDGEGNIINIVRRAKRRRKTAFKPSTEINYLGRSLGEEELRRELGLSLDEYHVAGYLRQELLRDFINSKPEERGGVLSRLLGLEHIDGLLKALSFVASEAGKKAKEVGKAWGEASERRSLTIKQARELEEEERSLSRELKTQSVDERCLLDTLKRIQDGLVSVASALGAKCELRSRPAEEAIKYAWELEGNIKHELRKIRDLRVDKLSNLDRLHAHLNSLASRYKEALSRVEKLELKAADLNELDRRRAELEDQIKEIETELEKSSRLRSFLVGRRPELEALIKSLSGIESKRSSLERAFGKEDKLKERIKNIEEILNEKRKQRENYEIYDRLIASCLEYLEAAKPPSCPVCERPIDYAERIQALKEKSEELKVREVERLNAEIKEKEKELSILKGHLSELGNLEEQLKNVRASINKLREEIRTKIGKGLEEPMLEQLDKEVSTIDQKISSLESERAKRLDALSEVNKAKERVEELSSIEGEICKIIPTTKRGMELIAEVNGKISRIEEELKGLEKLTDDINHLDEEAGKLSRIISFLTRKRTVEETRGKLPPEEDVKKLEESHRRLSDLHSSLQKILSALSAEREKFLEERLEKMKPLLNDYYKRLEAHAHYETLNIIKEGKGYWLRADSEVLQQHTYVRPKFSTAQLNLTAIAVFLSMAEAVARGLDLIVLDDPSQSLDKRSKAVLAKTIAHVSAKKQVIVTTQDGDFAEELRKASPEAKVYEFKSWDEGGPVVHEW